MRKIKWPIFIGAMFNREKDRNQIKRWKRIHPPCPELFEIFWSSQKTFLHLMSEFTKTCVSYPVCHSTMGARAYHKSKIFSNFFGTLIFSWVCIYINGNFWFWQFFFIFRWVKMPPKGYDEKNIKSLLSWSQCIFE